MVRQLVLVEIVCHILVGPVENGTNLDTTLVYMGHFQLLSMIGLAGTNTRHDHGDIEFGQCTLHRFNFAQVIVQLMGLFPQVWTVQGLHVCWRHYRLICTQIEIIELLQVLGKMIGFWW